MGHVIGIDTTYTGNPVSFNAAHGGTMKSISVPFSPTQDLHGYANPWPAGGGANILDPDKSSRYSTTAYGMDITYLGDDTFTIKGQSTTTGASAAFSVLWYSDTSLSGLGYVVQAFIVNDKSNNYKSCYGFRTSTEKAIAVVLDCSVSQDVDITLKFSVATASQSSWTPYANICPISGLTGLSVYVSPTQDPDDATVYNVDWTTQAGTVYGGTLDVVTGQLVVDRGCVNVSSSWYWNKSGSYPGGFYTAIDSAGTGQKNNTPFICSHAKTATSISQYVQGTCFCDGSINIRIMDGSDTVQDWKDYINAQITAGTPIQICYELATPLTYQLAPKQIATLIDQNYIWSSNNETLTAVLTAPATGFAGWLIKCVTNGTPVEIPLKYMRAETYTVTPDQRMEWSAERDVTGVLHRETVQNLPPKIEFNTPLMTNSDINALNSIIKAAFTSYLQRNITIQFYDPERNEYWEWDCYMPDVKYHIRNADTVNNIINYEELRYAFIGY